MVKKNTTQRLLGELSNMIGHEISSSLVKVYTTTKTSSLKNFKDGCKNDMGANMATFFARGGVLQRSSFLGNLKPLGKKLDLHKTSTWNK